MRFTANCDTVWVKTVQTSPSHDNYLRDVTPTSDGGCIAAGFKLYPSPQMGWLLKFDADGNICWQVNCDSTLTTTQVIPTISGNGLTLYPNPADHTLTVSTTNDLVGTYLEIYNSMGLLVWQQKLTANTITFATNHLANGAYFLRANNTTVKFTIIH